MKTPDYIRNPNHPITISVIGVGGTGSLIIPRLARMDYALKQMGHPGLMVFAYDKDVVEPNNVGRQNFSDCDVDKNKAIAIIEKANLAYGLLWEPVTEWYDSLKSKESNINIICVDNALFRKDFYKKRTYIKQSNYAPYENNFFDIDCGNGKNFGQVIISNRRKSMKNPVQIFPHMLEQDNEETQGIAGCSYEESLEKQDLFINDKIAVECVDLIWKLFREKTINVNGVITNSQKSKSLPILI